MKKSSFDATFKLGSEKVVCAEGTFRAENLSCVYDRKVLGTVPGRGALKGCDVPVVRQCVTLKNESDTESRPLRELYGLDASIELAAGKRLTLSTLRGDDCTAASFKPETYLPDPGERIVKKPFGGRSSDTSGFPFFDIAGEDFGLIFSIGWSGQWQMELYRDSDRLFVRAGFEDCDIVLRPGESIRSVSILYLYVDEPVKALHLRQMFVDAQRLYASPLTFLGQEYKYPVAIQCFDRYFNFSDASDETTRNFETEQAQKKICRVGGKLRGADLYWMDACWYKGTFRSGTGNYRQYEKGFPHGMRPVNDEAHKYGLAALTWFEPVRCDPGTEVYEKFRDDPHKIVSVPGLKRILVNIGNEEVFQYVLGEILAAMDRDHIDAFREDFNINPLGYLRSIEGEGRKGYYQIKFVENLYRLWDSLCAARPGLLIDNCASGGRLIDGETCARSFPLWHSDTGGLSETVRGIPVTTAHQNETMALSQYIPLHSTSSFEKDAYHMRSGMTGGIHLEFDFLNPDFDRKAAGRALDEVIEQSRYWRGDFQPLTERSTSSDVWCAYAHHLQKTDEGMVVAFRREDAENDRLTVALDGPDPEKIYDVTYIDEDRKRTKKTVPGRKLCENFVLTIRRKPGSLLVLYAPHEN
ncbi:MAG: alpha-galactosidase [Clostridia bacterium]|nr:alpha-galactosidase [Clostridia bacterium]